MRSFLIFLKRIYIYFFSFNLFLSLNQNKKKNLIYPERLGYGDHIVFCLIFYDQIKQKNNYLFCYDEMGYNVGKFFFPQDKIVKSFFFLKNSYKILFLNALKNYKFFKARSINKGNDKFSGYQQLANLNSKKLVLKKLNQKKIQKKIIYFSKKKYLTFYLKHFHSDKNRLIPSLRQTSNLKKVFKIIKYIVINKKTNLLILAQRNELSYKVLKKYVKEKKLSKRIYFLDDLSEDYNMNDQILLARNSIGFLGNHSGAEVIYALLGKKLLIYDAAFKIILNKFNKKKNYNYFFKKILFKKKSLVLTIENLNKLKNTNYNIQEVSEKRIINSISKIFQL